MSTVTNYGFLLYPDPVNNNPNESIPGSWDKLINNNFLRVDELCAEIEKGISETLPAFLIDSLCPIGSVKITLNAEPPSVHLLGTVWEQIAPGRVLVGVDPNDTDFAAPNLTGGSKTVQLSTSQIPSHSHGLNSHTHSISISATAASAGSHKHDVSVSGKTGSESAHTHSVTATGTAASAGAHSHQTTLKFDKDAATGNTKNRIIPDGSAGTNAQAPYTSTSAGAHTHTVSVSGTSKAGSSHTHSISISTTAVSAGAHTHSVAVNGTSGKASGNTAAAGASGEHENMPPFLTCYIWRRIA